MTAGVPPADTLALIMTAVNGTNENFYYFTIDGAATIPAYRVYNRINIRKYQNKSTLILYLLPLMLDAFIVLIYIYINIFKTLNNV